ncbi:MAG: sigma-E processing peptidase SpoIIGA [Firmicutes bacterium]|nr:sigma-E processing peptidase SpoIIGA [Bacillota bacterium]
MIVFVDVVFAINLCVDACLLLVAAMLLRRPHSLRRVVVAAALGSIYAVATLFPGTSWLRGFVQKWLASVVIVQIGYGGPWRSLSRIRGITALLRDVAAFYAVAFAAGGAVYGLKSLVTPTHSAFSGLAVVGGGVMWWSSFAFFWIVLAVPIALLCIRLLVGGVRKARRHSRTECTVRVLLDEHSVTLRAFLDTGNGLCDPLDGTPVALISARAAGRLWPSGLAELVARGHSPIAVLAALAAGDPFRQRLRLIPYQSVGAEGYLLGVRPDGIWLVRGDSQVALPTMLVATSRHVLRATDSYECVLPASVADATQLGSDSVESETAVRNPGEATGTSHPAQHA